MKKIISLLILITIVIYLLVACSENSSKISIGCTVYKYDDTFVSALRAKINKESKKKKDSTVEILDGQNSQSTQNERIDTLITKRCNVLAVNLVNRNTAINLIERVKGKKIPIVFFNTEPPETDLKKSDNVYYVGAKAEESGRLQGEIIADYWKNNHEKADKNKDNVLQYVMLTGDPGHQDAKLRTDYSIKALKSAGIKVEKLAEETARWNKITAQEKMSAILAAHGDKIEVVIANNDDMALGAIESLKASGYFKGNKYMPVVGVDATVPAIDELKKGRLLGTVLNNSEKQGEAIFKLSYILGKGEKPNKNNTGFEIKNKKYIWINYEKITKESANKILNN